jgi:hypothetical protein
LHEDSDIPQISEGLYKRNALDATAQISAFPEIETHEPRPICIDQMGCLWMNHCGDV